MDTIERRVDALICIVKETYFYRHTNWSLKNNVA